MGIQDTHGESGGRTLLFTYSLWACVGGAGVDVSSGESWVPRAGRADEGRYRAQLLRIAAMLHHAHGRVPPPRPGTRTVLRVVLALFLLTLTAVYVHFSRAQMHETQERSLLSAGVQVSWRVPRDGGGARLGQYFCQLRGWSLRVDFPAGQAAVRPPPPCLMTFLCYMLRCIFTSAHV